MIYIFLMTNRYKLLSRIYDETTVQIQGKINDTLLFNKLLDLDINGDNSVTFGESRYVYDEDKLNEFINDIANETSSMFSFDENEAEERFDGIIFVATQDSTLLSFNTSYSKNSIGTYMDLENCKDIIIGDLKTLRDNIKELVKNRHEFMNKVVANCDGDVTIDNDECGDIVIKTSEKED